MSLENGMELKMNDSSLEKIEQQANSKENASELLFDRLSNEKIREQVLNLLFQNEEWSAKNIVKKDGEKDENGAWKRDANGEVVLHDISYIPKSKEQVEMDYDTTLKRIMSKTGINFTSDEPKGGDVSNEEIIPLNWKSPADLIMRPSISQISIAEAHEKGHSIRQYSGTFFDNHFASGFDQKAVDFLQEEYEWAVKYMNRPGTTSVGGPPDYEEWRKQSFDYLFSGGEIAERMSQLKNYFGMKGDEEFTLEQLHYSQEHYILDTNVDNKMTQFLKAITPETENEFIRLINNSGI
jgi:hypothetical protein